MLEYLLMYALGVIVGMVGITLMRGRNNDVFKMK